MEDTVTGTTPRARLRSRWPSHLNPLEPTRARKRLTPHPFPGPSDRRPRGERPPVALGRPLGRALGRRLGRRLGYPSDAEKWAHVVTERAQSISTSPAGGPR